MGSIVQEFQRAASVRKLQTGGGFFASLVGITIGKRRKFGGYIVHAGVACMFLGFAGKTYSIERDFTLTKYGETIEIGGLTFRYDEFHADDNPNRTAFYATITVLKGKDLVTTLYPARNMYKKGGQESTTEVAIDRNLDKDIYLVLNGFDPQAKVANFKVFLNPLVNWVWLGFGILAIGTAVALLKDKWAEVFRPRRRGDPLDNDAPAPAHEDA
jgi:cytochrome c-type biogenesis protein CcmF